MTDPLFYMRIDIPPPLHRFDAIDLTRVDPVVDYARAVDLSAHFTHLQAPKRMPQRVTIEHYQKQDPTYNTANWALKTAAQHAYEKIVPPKTESINPIETLLFAPFAKNTRDFGPRTPYQAQLLARHDQVVDTIKNPKRWPNLVMRNVLNSGAVHALGAIARDLHALKQLPPKVAHTIANSRFSTQAIGHTLSTAKHQFTELAHQTKAFGYELWAGNLEKWDHVIEGSVAMAALAIAPNKAKTADALIEKARYANFVRQMPSNVLDFDKTMNEQGWGAFYSGRMLPPITGRTVLHDELRKRDIASGDNLRINGIGQAGDWGRDGITLSPLGKSIVEGWTGGSIRRLDHALPREHLAIQTVFLGKNWQATSGIFGVHHDPAGHYIVITTSVNGALALIYPGVVLDSSIPSRVNNFQNSRMPKPPIALPTYNVTLAWSGIGREGPRDFLRTAHSSPFEKPLGDLDRYTLFALVGPK